MCSNDFDILVAALSLPLRQRAELAHRLLLSLEELEEDGPVGATQKDIRERLAAIVRGDFRVEDAKAILTELRDTLASAQLKSKA